MKLSNRNQFTVTDDLVAKLEHRFINWILDTVMLILLSIVFIVITAAIATSYGNKTLITYLLVNPVGQFTFITIVRLIYYVSFETLFGQTVGKFVTQTKVVDSKGNPASHESILIRTLCRLIPFYEFSFFGIPPRGWHDSISKTYVVNKKELDQRLQRFRSKSISDDND